MLNLLKNLTVDSGREGISLERRAFAEKLECIMSENKILLTGNPKVFQKNDVIRGIYYNA